MIARMFLLPLLLCLCWFLYLQVNGYSLKQGQQGFVYILVGSGALLSFMLFMMWVTAPE
ncbi:hypothetical protein [Ferrimonas marina]|uniref:Uncharacterized protein n=1 Tax=Ferrimonas marina TaxID=299255 RepID=A0A1M5YJJ7_9GAMM|nr:hypothetical protein [Ferrimonas marina]SHI11683.1 hypothetical protein SAMN02745129_4279 [Ferrimonas marina]